MKPRHRTGSPEHQVAESDPPPVASARPTPIPFDAERLKPLDSTPASARLVREFLSRCLDYGLAPTATSHRQIEAALAEMALHFAAPGVAPNTFICGHCGRLSHVRRAG